MTKKIRGPIPSLISCSNGTPQIVMAKRSSPCSRCKNSIILNEQCIDLAKLGGAFKSTRRLCLACFKQIIEQTKSDLLKIEDEISKTNQKI